MNTMKLEGMIAKKADSLYIENQRSSDWLKIKFTNTDEAIICGLTEPRGSRESFGALILGKYTDGRLTYCGHTGTGFNNESLKQLYDRLQKMVIKTSPFETVPTTNMPVTWTKPELVCEIKYSEITNDGMYRHPVFLAIREDKEPEEIQLNPKNEKSKEMKAKAPLKKSANPEKKRKLHWTNIKSTSRTRIRSIFLKTALQKEM